MATIGILGAGTWGTALARMLTENGHAVTLWSALPQELETLRKTRRHPKLPDAVLPAALQYSADIAQACAAQIVVFAVPSVFIRSPAAAAKPFLQPETVLVSVAKGIEKDTFFTMTEILEDVLGKRRIRQGKLTVKRRFDFVGAKNILHRQGVSRRLNVGRVNRLQIFHVS